MTWCHAMKAFRDTYLTARGSPTYTESTNRNLDLVAKSSSAKFQRGSLYKSI